MKLSGSTRRNFNLPHFFVLLLVTAAPLTVAAHAEDDDQTWNAWNHNGSTIYLEWKGRSRNIYYLEPREGLVARGVRQGTLLFSGTRDDFNYTGTAYIFSKCGPKGYEVSGSLASDLKHITLRGKAPVVDASCEVTSYRDDVLEFDAVDSEDCGCQCAMEIPVADYDEYSKNGVGTSCPYLYAWSDKDREWRSYGKIIHVAQGRARETVEKISLRELSTRFRLVEEEPENSFIDKVELRVETEDGAIYAFRPNLRHLAARDGNYMRIPSYKSIAFKFELPSWVDRATVRNTALVVTGYYEGIGSARPSLCFTRVAQQTPP